MILLSKLRLLFFVIFTIILFENRGISQCYTNGSGTFLSGETYFYSNEFAGSQFFNENWLKGDVYLISGDVVTSQLIRYNAFTDDLIWFETKSNNFIKLDKGLISEFQLFGDSETVIHFVKNNSFKGHSNMLDGFFIQKLFESEVSLYVQRKLIESGMTKNVNIGGKSYRRLMIIPDDKYFISISGGELIGISPRKKSLINAILNQSKSIDEASLRKEIPRIYDESDLIEAIQVINTLYKKF